jgi:phosphotransferase system HPr (HPr) family protein
VVSRTVTIASRVGLHARPAATFSRAAAATGLPVTLTAEGTGAEQALDGLAELLASEEDGQ